MAMSRSPGATSLIQALADEDVGPPSDPPAGDLPHRRGLATAGGPEEAHELTVSDVERKASTATTLPQALETDLSVTEAISRP
jgi:hypothetical protein